MILNDGNKKYYKKFGLYIKYVLVLRVYIN